MTTPLRPLLIIAALLTCTAHGGAAEGAPDFSTQVRPILSKHCFSCHGPDDKSRKGKLRLDQRDAAHGKGKSGEVAIVPGKPSASEVIKRILTQDEDDLMPPRAAKKPLSPADQDILRRWVASGAEYQAHWAFQAPTVVPLPPVRQSAWPRNDIDRFVLARLEAEGLQPAAEADRATLIRRVTLDLIGLPPTPAEVDAFIGDPSPTAFDTVVDRLLASPRYGERWARKWLDLARYADTNGYEKDRQRSIWPWRDWVITALNADMPFDQFTIRQLAGDLLPDATQQDHVATGFHRNTMINEEGGIDPLEYRYHAMADRVATTGKTWLGLTTGCAQCHTHKFDPITHHEYFQLMALMNNADEPVLPLKPADHVQRVAEAETKIATLIDGLPATYPVDTRVWTFPGEGTVTNASDEAVERQDDGSWRFSGEGAERDTVTATISLPAGTFSVLRLEVLPDGERPVGRSESGNVVITDLVLAQLSGAATPPVALKLKSAQADFSQKDYDVKGAIDGDPKSGWALHGSDLKAPHTASFTLVEPLVNAQPVRLQVTLAQQFGQRHTMCRFRLSLGHDDPARGSEEVRRTAAAQAFARWLAAQEQALVRWRPLRPVAASSAVPILTILPDDSVLSSGDLTKSDIYTTTFSSDLIGVTAVRLEVLPDERLPGGGPGRVYYEGQPGDFLLCELTAAVDGKNVAFARAQESFANGGNSAAKAVDGKPDTGWTIRDQVGREQAAMFVFERPLERGADLTIAMLFERYYASGLGRYRISVTNDPPPAAISALPAEVAAVLLVPATARTAEQVAVVRRHWLAQAPELKDARHQIDGLRNGLRSYPTSLVFSERPREHTRPTFIHHRGEYLQPGEQVQPGTIAVLNAFPANAPRNRLGLAQWLVARNNPLTARVTVNRHWASFFGRGLVRTVDDFGYQGEAPSHPALLDWLAVTFMERGWSQKTLHRLIVGSATYRQSARISAELLQRDPHNVLLARGPRFRVEAEVIRDSLLTAAGLLSAKIGGPSVFPPQPASVTTEGAYGGLEWKVSAGEDRYRRGLYTFMKRTAPYAMTNAFDAPSGDFCIAQREISNSPLQALMMLNDAVVLEAAQALARVVITQAPDDAGRISVLVRRCLTRAPSAEEVQRFGVFIARQRARLAAHELDAAKLAGTGEGDATERAVWTTLARVVMNTDEFVTKE